MDKFERAIADLCYALDKSLYIPFRDKLDDTDFGFKKEIYKQLIEMTVNNLK